MRNERSMKLNKKQIARPIYLNPLVGKTDLHYIFDAEFEHCRWMLDELQVLITSGQGELVIPLPSTPPPIPDGSQVGRRGKSFLSFTIMVTRSQINKPGFIERKDVLIMVMTLSHLARFSEAIKKYIDGKWDFTFDRILFWPYAQRTADGKNQ